MINKYVNIIKNKRCSRKDFWIFYLFMWGIFIAIFLIGFIFENYYSYGFNTEFYNMFSGILIIFLVIVCILLQIFRLRDAGLTPLLLFMHLLGLINESFGFIVNILILIFLCLPSQQIPTSDISKHSNIKEN